MTASRSFALEQACRSFAKGQLGHLFSRALTTDEADLLRAVIDTHGCCVFTNKDAAPVGAWLCTCKECELLITILAIQAQISIIAHQTGEKNFVLTGENEVEIQVQTFGTEDRERASIVVKIASQIAAEVAANVAARVAAEVAAKVACSIP